MPARFGAVGVGAREQQAPVGVRGAARPELLPVHHVAVAVAAGGRPQAGQVGAGLGLGEALAPDLAVEDRRAGGAGAARRCRPSSSVDAAWWIDTNASTSRGRVVRRPAPGTAPPARAPTCRRPTRRASAARRSPAPRSSWNHACWNATNSSSDTPVCASRQPAGTWARHQSRTSVAELLEVASSTVTRPGRARRPCRPMRAGRARRGVAAEAERQPPERLAVARQPRQGGLVAEADRAVQLVGDAEHDVGRLERGQRAARARRRAPRVGRPRCSTARTWRAPPARCARPRRR